MIRSIVSGLCVLLLGLGGSWSVQPGWAADDTQQQTQGQQQSADARQQSRQSPANEQHTAKQANEAAAESGEKAASEDGGKAAEKQVEGSTDNTDHEEPTDEKESKDSEDSAETEGEAKAEEQEKQGSGQSDGQARRARVAAIRISGLLDDAPDAYGLFGELSPNLYQLLRRLDQARSDDNVNAVWLELRNPVVGSGRVHEIRAAIERLRRSGKRVIADLHMATSADYLIASSCDQIVMPESGMLVLPGVRLEVLFFDELLKKIGVRADMLQMGQYKGAAEPYERSRMSEAFRQQMELVVDDLYHQMIDTIALDRKLQRDEVRKLVDQGLFTAADAQQRRLIDHVAYEDQIRSQLESVLEVDTLSVVANYGRRKVETDFSGMTGMFKLLELFTGAKTTRPGSQKKKVALIYASGPIVTGSSQTDLFGGQTLGSDTLVRALKKADEDKSVEAIVLRVNSPGGSALASDLIWHALRKTKKPTVASMSDMAASGGYYISMGCDRIVAEPSTLTGSIGVVGGKIALGDFLQRLGITSDHISRGQNSGIFDANEPFTDSEREVIQKMMQATYDQFAGKVSQSRGLDKERLEAAAQGRLWTGRQAKHNGLVDEVGSLRDAIRLARQLAGMDPDEETELLILPEARTFFEQVLQGPDAGQVHLRLPARWTESKLLQPVRYLEQLRPVLSEPVYLCLPYYIQVR